MLFKAGLKSGKTYKWRNVNLNKVTSTQAISLANEMRTCYDK